MSDEIFYEVIKDKIIDWAEVVCVLFEHCNLTCVFCPQDHNSRAYQTPIDILLKVDPIVKFINSRSVSDYHIHIMGGELFQDELVEQGFLDVYSEMINQIKSKVNPGKNLIFNFLTNLVYERNVDKVLDFYIQHDLKVPVSYDPSGRFNAEQLAIFKRNIEVFKPYVRHISLVLSKQNIDKVLKGDDYYDYLYDNFNMTWDHFLPGQTGMKAMMPKESELFAFYKLTIDRYPNTVNTRAFLKDSKPDSMSCTRGSSFTILHDNTIPKGCSGAVFMKDHKTDNLEGTQIVENFIKERSCFSCEYYKRCSFSCFVSSDYKEMTKDLDECVFKKIFRYADGTLEQ